MPVPCLGVIATTGLTESDGTEHEGIVEGRVRNWEGTVFYYTKDNPEITDKG